MVRLPPASLKILQNGTTDHTKLRTGSREVSRIVLGMNFLSDVLAGVVMGVALGCASITAFASLGLI